MDKKKAVKSAEELLPSMLSHFDEFVGTGIVPWRQSDDGEMAVAVYVSRPEQQLSTAFKEAVPAVLSVTDNSEEVAVRTKIVNVGELQP